MPVKTVFTECKTKASMSSLDP